MKRFIAILSVALMAGCALALAEDSDAPNADAMNPGQSTSQETTTVKKSAKTAKTCTDDNGNVLKRGETGFKACWNAQHPKQESGTAATEQKNNKMKSDTGQVNPNNDNTSEPHSNGTY